MRTAVVVSDLGNEEIMGTVVRTAGAIDPVTRTLLTEVHVPNAQRRLLPGMFATVRLKVPSSPSLRVPAIALIVRGDGTQVAQWKRTRCDSCPSPLGATTGPRSKCSAVSSPVIRWS